MTTYGLLIDYEYCTNCGSCQVSCKEEHGYPVGKTGISVHADGPWRIDDDNINFNYFPLPTDLCDLCAERTGKGKEPLCVHHCLANVLYYGPVEELAKKLEDVHVENELDHRKAAHIEVEGTGSSTFGAHRHDAKVGEYSEDAV